MKRVKKLYWVVWKQRFEHHPLNSAVTLFKHPWKRVFMCVFLVFVFSSNVSGNPQMSPNFIIGDPENPTVSIPGKSPLWNIEVARLVNQILNNIPPGGDPEIGVFDFRVMKTGQTTEFSSRFKEDFIILLSQVETLRVKEVGNYTASTNFRQLAKEKGLDYFVRGFYKYGKRGLSIWSQLISASTGNIVSSGKSEIARNAIFEDDLVLLDRLNNQDSSVRAFDQMKDYEIALDHLIALKPNNTNLKVKVWTDKKEYQVGDKITFFIKAEKPCYLILFDVRPNGQTKIIFPNEDSMDNFIQEDKARQLLDKSSEIEFHVQGPAGLERLKALVSSQPLFPQNLDMRGRFYSIEENSLKGIQDLNRFVELFSNQEDLEWTEDYMEVFIYEKNQSIMRGSRKIPLIDKPKKPIDMIGTMGQETEPN